MDKGNIDSKIKQGILWSKIITKKHSKTFYFASHFLSKDKRNACFCIYAICRLSDDSVDEDTPSLERLNRVKENIDLTYGKDELTDEILISLRYFVNRFAIPKDYFEELLSGMNMDLYKNRYRNFKELYEYSYKVAGVIGLMMLKILQPVKGNGQLEGCAVNLGIALQLTNILRDIAEDHQRNRIYLPEDEMSGFKVTENQIANKRLDDNFINLLKFQTQRARKYYKEATPGIKLISDVRSRLVITLIKDLYSSILDVIEINGYDIFSKRASLSFFKKIIGAGKALLKREFL